MAAAPASHALPDAVPADDPTLGAVRGLGTDGWATLHTGVRLHYVIRGDGPLVVLLHGFPQYWGAWRHQIPALADAGFRVVAPDLRGYNLSDRPPRTMSYDIGRLAWDVAGLVDHFNERRAAIVGHDWGGAIAWHLAARRPQLVSRLAILNAPHPTAYAHALRHSDQALRAWYVALFQLPRVPELLLAARDHELLARVLREGPARAGAFDEDEIARHRLVWSRPRALHAMLAYYRAAVRRVRRLRRRATTGQVACPTLVLWGMRDRYLSPQLLDGLAPWAPDLRVVRLEEATHWVMEDAPERVNAELLGFLRG